MTSVSVYDAKTHLSRLLRRVRDGEEIVIASAGRPVARLVPMGLPARKRELGGDEGIVRDADDFNAPLPRDLLDEFYGMAAPRTRSAKAASRSRAPRHGR